MEPTTFILMLSVPALLAGVVLAVQKRGRPDMTAMKAARQRAIERASGRAFADTRPMNIREDLEYSIKGITVTDQTSDVDDIRQCFDDKDLGLWLIK